jgi:cytochrome c oxidase subunit II
MSPIPLNYLSAAGQRASTILPLTWFTIGISCLVCVVIATLLWLGVRRAQASGGAEALGAVEVTSRGNGVRWIGVGILISGVLLLATLVWTMVALAKASGPPGHTPLTLDVTGRQWWWEVRYDAQQPDQGFTTANEIHIPVGVPVLVRLHGGDVIHSFWVPQLSGKTDTIPGQVNVAWLEAEKAGRYRGQCAEYCGAQHAHMAFEVVAESPQEFQRWREQQLQPAPEPTTDEQKRGMELVEFRCGLCHQVRGTTAAARAAPDLTHLMSRRMIASGTLPNGVGTLQGWIEGAEQLKPGTLMPDQDLNGKQLTDTVAYLETLK